MNEVRFDEHTTIPLPWLAACIPFAVGGIFWLSAMYISQQANAKSIDDQKQRIDSQYAILLDIRDRVIRLEEDTKLKKRK